MSARTHRRRTLNDITIHIKLPADLAGEFSGGAYRTVLPIPCGAGIPLSTRNDLGAFHFPNLLRIEPFTVLVQRPLHKITRRFGG